MRGEIDICGSYSFVFRVNINASCGVALYRLESVEGVGYACIWIRARWRLGRIGVSSGRLTLCGFGTKIKNKSTACSFILRLPVSALYSTL